MLDVTTLAAIAASAVAVVTPLLQKAVEKGDEEIGKSSVGAVLDKLKQRLGHAGAKDALAELAQLPGDTAAQGALNMQLRKALAADPELAAFLKQWVTESEPTSGISQTSNVQGDNNKTTQIVGSGNSVS